MKIFNHNFKFLILMITMLFSTATAWAGNIGTNSPTDYLINTTTTGGQEESRVAMDDFGNFVVVWQSFSGGQWDIYAQRYNSSGTALGSEFLVNTTTSGHQLIPSIAMDNTGNFIIAWDSDDGDGTGIYAQRYNASGVAQGSEFLVNTNTVGNQHGAAIAMDPVSGSFWISWMSYNAALTTHSVRAQRYNASGVAQGSEFQVNSTAINTGGSNAYDIPSIAMWDDNIVIVWISAANTIFAQRYNASGVAQGSEFLASTSGHTGTSVPFVLVDKSNAFFILYLNGTLNQTIIRKFNSSGTFLTSTTSAMYGDDSFISAALDVSGNLTVVGRNGSGQYTADGQKFSNNLVPLGLVGNISRQSTDARSPIVAQTNGTNGDHSVIVWWGNGGAGDSNGIFGKLNFSIFSLPLDDGSLYLNFNKIYKKNPISNVLTEVVSNTELVPTNNPIVVEYTWASPYTDFTTQFPGSVLDIQSPSLAVLDYPSYNQVSDGGTSWAFSPDNNTWRVTYQPPAGGWTLNSTIQFYAFTEDSTVDGHPYPSFHNENSTYDDASRYVTIGASNAASYGTGGNIGANFGTNYYVNSYKPDDQRNPAVAINSSGTSIIAWSNINPSTGLGPITAQKYDSSGIAQGTVFKINDSDGFERSQIKTAINTSGEFVLTWMVYNGSSSDIYAKKYDSSGVAVGPEFLVNTTSAGFKNNPQVALADNGKFVVTWWGNGTGDTGGVFARIYNSDGTPASSEVLVNESTSSTQAYSSVIMDSSNNFIIVWGSNHSGNYDIYGRKFNVSGTALTSETLLNDNLTGLQHQPIIKWLNSGNLIVNYNSDNSYRIRQFNSSLTALSASVEISDEIGEDRAAFDIDLNGNGILVFPKGNIVYAKKFTADGSIAALTQISPAGEEPFTYGVAMNTSTHLIVWSDLSDFYPPGGQGYDIFAKLNFALPAPSNSSNTNLNVPNGYTGTVQNNQGSIVNNTNQIAITFANTAINAASMNFQSINFHQNQDGHPVVSIPSNSEFGSAVNAGLVTFNVMLKGTTSKVPILFVDNGTGPQAVNDFNGNLLPGMNFYVASLTIQRGNNASTLNAVIKHLTEYSIGVVDRVTFTPMKVTGNTNATLNYTAVVYDNYGNTVSNAPVTFNIATGTGTFVGAFIKTTNASGIATVNVKLGASDFVLTAFSDGTYGYAHGSHEQVPFTGISVTPYATTVNFDGSTATGNGNALNVPILHIYGVSVNPIITATVNILPSQNYYFVHKIINKGNNSDRFTIVPVGIPANWLVQIVSSNSDALPALSMPITIANGSSRNIYIRVSPPDVEGSGAFAVKIKSNSTSSYADNGSYQGFDPESTATNIFGATDSQAATDNAATIDAIAPSLSVIIPNPSSSNVPVNIQLFFTVFDIQSGVSANSLAVSVNNLGVETAYKASLVKATADGGYTYAVTLNPIANFGYGSTVRVTFNAEDTWSQGPNPPNALHYAFSFTTISGPDLTVLRQIEGLVTPNGSLNTLVPGARIKYHDQVYNQGYGSAVSVNIEVPIPVNTTFYQIGTPSQQDRVKYRHLNNSVSGFTTSGDVKAIIFEIDTHPISTTKNIRYEVTVD